MVIMQYYNNNPYPSSMPPCMMMQEQYMTPQMMPGTMMMGPGIAPQAIMPQTMADCAAEQDEYTYPQNLSGALQLIRDAVSGEREDELFYDYLISVAPAEDDKEIIRGIRDNERKHFRLFRQIYCELTGQMPPQLAKDPELKKPASYCDGLRKALHGELGAVEKYRRIFFALQNRRLINMITEIITDELRHASLYNYLITKNRCFNK
jgi:rubrerythrin